MRHCLITSNALLQLSVQPNFWVSHKVVKNGQSLLVNRAINRPKAARQPVSRCISFLVLRTGVSSTTFTWSWFILIPH